ncbi:MAG: hypothetical protein WA102_01795 [Candidatus Methanoperedens sp.]
MPNGKNESFIRWQGRTIKQLSFVNNLMIGLATGLLAFQTNLIFNYRATLLSSDKWLLLISILMVLFSLFFGCCAALNRLSSFQKTSHVARKREEGGKKREGIKEMRDLVKKLDGRTWLLLQVQIVLFALGGLFLLLVSLHLLSLPQISAAT